MRLCRYAAQGRLNMLCAVVHGDNDGNGLAQLCLLVSYNHPAPHSCRHGHVAARMSMPAATRDRCIDVLHQTRCRLSAS